MEHVSSGIFLDVVIVLGFASIVASFFHYLRIPTLVGFIGAGVLIGPNGFNMLQSIPDVELVSEIGIVFLMFTLGLEFSFAKVKQLKKELLLLGLIQVLATGGATIFVAMEFFELNFAQSFLAGSMVALSSTAVVLKLLGEHRDFESPQGNAAVAIALFQDIAVVFIMMAIPLLAVEGSMTLSWSSESLINFGLKTVALVAGILIAGRYLIPYLLSWIIATGSREIFFFMAIFLCVGVAYAVEQAGLSLSLGAFVAGVLISESPYGKQAMGEIAPLRDNFLGLFFISIGMLVQPMFFVEHWVGVFGFGLALLVGKAFIVYAVMKLNKYSHNVAFVTAALMFQLGEFSFIIANVGLELAIIERVHYQYFLSVAVLSLVATPFVYRLSPRLSARAELPDFAFASLRRLSDTFQKWNPVPAPTAIKKAEGPSNHAVIIGFGHAGKNIADALKELSFPYSILEMNYKTVEYYKDKEPIHFGDAAKPEVLEEVHLEKARLVVLTVNGSQMTSGILGAIRQIRPDIKIIVRCQYLLEAKQLPIHESDDVVVAEFETSLEILARTLQNYGVSSSDIHKFLVNHREAGIQSIQGYSTSLRQRIELPTWEALSAIQPVRVSKLDGQKSLQDLNIRQRTGASIVAIFREGFGSHIASPEFVIKEGDVLYSIGSADDLKRIEAFFRGEPTQPHEEA